MGYHTIGDRRGSVRGAPPDLYIPFGSFGNEEEATKPAIQFFGFLLKGAGFFLLVMLALVVWVAFTDPDA